MALFKRPEQGTVGQVGPRRDVFDAVQDPGREASKAPQPGRCRCRIAKNSAGGEPAPRLPFGTTHDLLLSLVLAGFETLPSGQKRVFSWIINGLMLKVTISLELHEDEQTCHLNLGGLETLPAVRSARVTASN